MVLGLLPCAAWEKMPDRADEGSSYFVILRSASTYLPIATAVGDESWR